jgi:hypothetical protein
MPAKREWPPSRAAATATLAGAPPAKGTKLARETVAVVAFAVHIDQSLAEAEDGTFHQVNPSTS